MDERYLELFPIINAAVKKYLVRSKYIKRIRLKGKDKHSILYSVEWTFEPNKAAPISHYFSVSSTGRTLYLELDVPGFHSHSSPTEKKMDLEIALNRPGKVKQVIKDIAQNAVSVASNVVSDMENNIHHYSNLQDKVQKLANDNPELRSHLVPILKKQAGDSKRHIHNAEVYMGKGDEFHKKPLKEQKAIMMKAITNAKQKWKKVDGILTDLSKSFDGHPNPGQAMAPIEQPVDYAIDAIMIAVIIANKYNANKRSMKAAIFKYDSSTPIDKRVLIRNLNKVLGGVSRGFFTDEHWRGPKRVWEALNKIGITWDQTKNFYDNKMPNESKTWKFELEFTSKKGRPGKLYGHMVASGAGSVQDPLSRYDVVVYVG